MNILSSLLGRVAFLGLDPDLVVLQHSIGEKAMLAEYIMKVGQEAAAADDGDDDYKCKVSSQPSL